VGGTLERLAATVRRALAMQSPRAILAALSALALSLASVEPAAAAGPGPWVGGHALGRFGLGAALAHSVFGLAALPFVIVGAAAAAAAAQSEDEAGYAAAPQYGYAPPAYEPAPQYYRPPPTYYAPPPPYYYAPRPAYYPPAPRYYAPPPVHYGRPAPYYGARAGYYASSGYQAARRPGYYHYPH
jgi:hypothetical protein